jgi:hypothetical protein
MHRNELKTRQKTIETLRFEFISGQGLGGPGAQKPASALVEEGSVRGA